MEFISELKKILTEDSILLNENMAGHTTFRAGGPAKYFVEPSNPDQIRELVRLSVDNDIDYFIVGNGSNLLVSDEGFDGLIIHFGKKMSEINVNDNIIEAGAGALLSAIGAVALNNSLEGFEFACQIPGSLGGACLMNAGAYGGEMKDVLVSATVVTPTGEIKEVPVEAMELGYRHSIFLQDKSIVVSAKIKLTKGNPETIKEKMADLASRRREKQPLEYPSAGSTFKRPEGYFAGALIEQAGLKGKGVGDACVSEKHAGFVVNKGSATASDIYATMQMVSDTVMRENNVLLEPEVRLVGKF